MPTTVKTGGIEFVVKNGIIAAYFYVDGADPTIPLATVHAGTFPGHEEIHAKFMALCQAIVEALINNTGGKDPEWSETPFTPHTIPH
jgi:hypothetical protein